MSEEKQVSYPAIEQAVWNLKMKCFAIDSLGRRKNAAVNVYHAVSWYIGTARASAEWIRLFINLSEDRMDALIDRALRTRDASTLGMMKVINKYLDMDNDVA